MINPLTELVSVPEMQVREAMAKALVTELEMVAMDRATGPVMVLRTEREIALLKGKNPFRCKQFTNQHD